MQIEAVEPIHAAFAACGEVGKDFVSQDAAMVTNRKFGRINKADAGALAKARFEVDTQRCKRQRQRFHEATVNAPSRKLATLMPEDFFDVVVLEGTVAELMKLNHNRHDLTQAQAKLAVSLFGLGRE